MIAQIPIGPMEFDPTSAKWTCCCCHLSSGLKIVGSVEAFVSAVVAFVAGFSTSQFIRNETNVMSAEFFMYVCLFLVAVFYGVSAILLVAGIQLTQKQLMYPTLVARAALVLFVQVFGVSVVVKPRDESGSRTFEDHPHDRMSEPPITLRLILLVFIMVFVSIGILYTIYLVVRCLHYVTSWRKLLDRRNSLIAAGQIDQCYTDAMYPATVSNS
ncbi:hypothetical protein QR680_009626 [Steinernema hermaphroditum]|uniref:DUF7027 domain-containing protein n=1 Tax=Steinernema hermaphroditum TaxID=289476 RepID=A0AA39IL33_9BILA|nr:hypothetical protein QR680_009626 [Steinernema hermaphroditum]